MNDRNKPPPHYDIFERYKADSGEMLHGWEAVGTRYKNPKPYAEAVAEAWKHYNAVIASRGAIPGG